MSRAIVVVVDRGNVVLEVIVVVRESDDGENDDDDDAVDCDRKYVPLHSRGAADSPRCSVSFAA